MSTVEVIDLPDCCLLSQPWHLDVRPSVASMPRTRLTTHSMAVTFKDGVILGTIYSFLGTFWATIPPKGRYGLKLTPFHRC